MKRPNLLRVAWMEWRDLVFLHWPVEPAALQGWVPADLELDLFRGKAWISIVAFNMTTAPALVPRLFALETPEINVRTYVRYGDQQPGLYFLSLDVNSWLATAGARLGLGLPYFHAGCQLSRNGRKISFDADRTLLGGSFELTAEPEGDARRATDPLDRFLVDRYALYTDRPGTMLRVQVHHRPYLVQPARVIRLAHDLFPTEALPTRTHYCAGVDVDVFRPELAGVRIPQGGRHGLEAPGP